MNCSVRPGLRTSKCRRFRRQNFLGQRIGGGNTQASPDAARRISQSVDLGDVPGDLLDVTQNQLALRGRLANAVGGVNKVVPSAFCMRASFLETVVSFMAEPNAGAGESAAIPESPR